jgi:hypothetical protein
MILIIILHYENHPSAYEQFDSSKPLMIYYYIIFAPPKKFLAE